MGASSAARRAAENSKDARSLESVLPRAGRTRTEQLRIRAYLRGFRPLARGAGNLQLQRARRRQHGGLVRLWLFRTESALAETPASGGDPLLLRDDRAASGVL